MFLGLGFVFTALAYAAISAGASALIGAISKPKQKEPEGRIPGSAIGRNIPEVFNRFPIEDTKWVSPNVEKRMFVPKEKGKEQQLYFTGIGAVCTSENGAKIYRLWVFGDLKYIQRDPAKGYSFYNREVDWNEGLPNQLPFQYWIEEYGSTQLNAFRNICTIGFYSLGVHEQGNTAPNLRIVVESNTLHDCSTIIQKKLKDATLRDDQIDVTELVGESIRGYQCERNGNSFYDELEDLLLDHFSALVELNTGVISARKLERPTVTLNIPLNHLRVNSEGSNNGYFIKRTIKNADELPAFIMFSFIDPLKDYETNTIASSIHPQAVTNGSESISTNEVMRVSEAKVIANKLLYQMYDRLIEYEFSVIYEYVDKIQPLDVITIDNKYSMQIQSIDEKADYTLQIKALNYDASSIGFNTNNIFTSDLPSSETSTDDIEENTDLAIQNGELYLLDLPLGFDDPSGLIMYVFANYTGDIYLSRYSEPYQNIYTIENTGTYGNCDNILGFETKDISGTTYPVNINLSSEIIYDDTSVLNVTLLNGSISPLTSNEFEDESILLFVGKFVNDAWEGEYIVANQVINLGNNQYSLYDLKRGLRSTEYYIDKHVSGEMVFLIDQSTETIDLTIYDINRYLRYKILHDPLIQNIDDVTENTIYYYAKGITSYCPVDVSLTDLGNGDIQVNYTSRTRFGTNQQFEQDLHHFVFNDPVTGNSVRQIDDTTNYIYTLADQQTDGLVAPFDLDAYRVSAINGRSNPNYVRDITPTV